MSILSLLLCGALFAIAVGQHRNILEMLITAISLAVAAVPEGLPAVVTICLALSVTRMVKVNTIVRDTAVGGNAGRPSAWSRSDKTGTLTQNRMTVEKCFVENRLADVEEFSRGISGGFFVWDGFVQRRLHRGENRMGDPTELALLDVCERLGVEKEALERRFPPFWGAGL